MFNFLSSLFSAGRHAQKDHLERTKVQRLKDRADLEAQIVRDRRSNSPLTYFHEQRLIDTDRELGSVEEQLYQLGQLDHSSSFSTDFGYTGYDSNAESKESNPFSW